jgi:hypothetical protein
MTRNKGFRMGDWWENVLVGTGEEDEGRKVHSTERNPKAIRINTSLAWISRGEDGLGRGDRLRSGL